MARLVSLLGVFGDLLPTPLRQRVDLSAYAAKLQAHADLGLAVVGEDTAGLVAMYANDTSTLRAHIPVVAVLPGYRGLGLGAQLLRSALRLAASRGMQTIDLEVDRSNKPARLLYQANAFVIVERDERKLRMQRPVSQRDCGDSPMQRSHDGS